MAWRRGGEGEGPGEDSEESIPELPVDEGSGTRPAAAPASPFPVPFSVRRVPIPEEPATEEPATEEPATEEPATVEPATKEPTTGAQIPMDDLSLDDPSAAIEPPRRSRRPAFTRRTPSPEATEAIPPTDGTPPPPPPLSATTVTDDPLAPFLLPVDSPRHKRKRGIARMVEQAPNWQKLALGAALLVALLVLGYALFFRDDAPDIAASPSVPAFTNPPATTPAPATVLPSTPPAASAPIAGLVDRNCSNFSTPQEAQSFYKESGGPEKDLHGLDPDKNGTACDDAANPIGVPPATSPAASIPQPSATQTTTASP